MLRILFICLALSVFAQAQSLDELISHSLQTHDSLKVIEQKLSSFDESLELSQNFQNPELSLSVSDIQFADSTNRSIEPMQYESVTIKQKIPYFGKRGANASYVNAQKAVVFTSLEVAKIALIKEIKLSAYTIWEYEEKLHIINEYIELNTQNIELSRAYNSSADSWHVQSMNMGLLLSSLKIKRSGIKSTLDTLYAKLSYLANEKINSLEVDVEVTKPRSLDEYLEVLKNNKSYQQKIAQVDEKNSLIAVNELDSKIDPVVQVGYFHRTKFEDYVSVTLGASLPLYGSETLRVQKARKEVLEAKFMGQDFYEKLKSDLSWAYAQFINSYDIYTIITNESLPEVEHMFELSKTRIENGKNLLDFTGVIEKKLNLKEQQIAAIASYKRSQSDIEALLGETK